MILNASQEPGFMLSVRRDRYSVNVICLYQYSCASLHATTAVKKSVLQQT